MGAKVRDAIINTHVSIGNILRLKRAKVLHMKISYYIGRQTDEMSFFEKRMLCKPGWH